MRSTKLATPSGTTAGQTTGIDGVHVEDVRLRNYDHDTPHVVELSVSRDGSTVFSETYRLPPGTTVSEPDVFRTGEHEVRVVVDGDRREPITMHVGDSVAHTAVVELGNGVVSVTDESVSG